MEEVMSRWLAGEAKMHGNREEKHYVKNSASTARSILLLYPA